MFLLCRAEVCLSTGGGAFWGCLRTGQPAHPPKLTHPPTHPDPPLLPDPPPTPQVEGGGGYFIPHRMSIAY